MYTHTAATCTSHAMVTSGTDLRADNTWAALDVLMSRTAPDYSAVTFVKRKKNNARPLRNNFPSRLLFFLRLTHNPPGKIPSKCVGRGKSNWNGNEDGTKNKTARGGWMQKCESLIRVRQSRLAEASYMRYEMRKTHIEGSWRKTHFLCVELRGKRTTHFCVTYKYIYVRQPSLTCNKFLFYISLFLTPLLQRE